MDVPFAFPFCFSTTKIDGSPRTVALVPWMCPFEGPTREIGTYQGDEAMEKGNLGSISSLRTSKCSRPGDGTTARTAGDCIAPPQAREICGYRFVPTKAGLVWQSQVRALAWFWMANGSVRALLCCFWAQNNMFQWVTERIRVEYYSLYLAAPQ